MAGDPHHRYTFIEWGIMILNMERSQTHLTTTDRVREQMRLHLGLMDADGEDWDYAAADTKTHTHCYHIYPAMMIPQVARRLIRTYGAGARLLLDPFCGSGTSLVEARLAGLNAIGIDLNPFATLLARAKTTDYDLPSVYKQSRKLRHFVDDLLKRGMEVPAPQFYNIDYWFKPEAQRDLALLRYAIESVIPVETRDFFWVAFAATVRESSNTRRGEYKLYRIPESELHTYTPRVFTTFWERLGRNLRGLEEFLNERDPRTHAQVYERDVRDGIPLTTGAVDIVVTSPPYGDSQTTVAYGQFSRLVLQWLGYDDDTAKSIDRRALGGTIAPTKIHYNAPSLESTLEAIGQASHKRAAQVKQFYDDFAQCFPEISRVVKPGGYGCFVVGNRTVKGVRIPTDRILIEIAACFGWAHITTHHRNIPNKRMPLRNSPSNKPGELAPTMTEEHIVVLQKQR
jgi:site-specific DNA-methyltransferase (cytosine-N4-specific)